MKRTFNAIVHYHPDGLVVRPIPKDSLVPNNNKLVSPEWGYWAGNPFYRCFVIWREYTDIIGGIEHHARTQYDRNKWWAGAGNWEGEVTMDLYPYEFDK